MEGGGDKVSEYTNKECKRRQGRRNNLQYIFTLNLYMYILCYYSNLRDKAE